MRGEFVALGGVETPVPMVCSYKTEAAAEVVFVVAADSAYNCFKKYPEAEKL